MNAGRAPFRVGLVDYGAARDALHAVRDAVFVDEQGVPAGLERDALDPQCAHALAQDADGRPIGAARMAPDHRIGRMAVLRGWRSAGVGGALLQALLHQARARGWDAVTLHAQVSAERFYRRHGFVAEGPRFMEAGIEHQSMRLRLDQPRAVADRDAAVAVVASLALGARRLLCIRSRDLDPGLFDAPAVLDALRAFATRGQGNEVRILLQDADAPQRAHAPLLPLAQRLPSVFVFREVADPVDRTYPSAFVASDAGGLYFRPLGHRFEGEARDDDGGHARQLLEHFRPVWERARPCTELRALGL